MSNAMECKHPANELLPWYVNGTLQKDELCSVDEHIQECGTCRADSELLIKLSATVNDKTITPIVPQADAAKLFSTIDATNHSAPSTSHAIHPGLIAGLIAATLVVAVFAWRGIAVNDSPTRFETATSVSNTASIDYVLRIRFEADTSEAARNAVFSALEGKDVRLEDGANTYRAVVSVPGTSLEEVEAYTDKIESRVEVSQVDIVAVQIPTRKNP